VRQAGKQADRLYGSRKEILVDAVAVAVAVAVAIGGGSPVRINVDVLDTN